MPLLAADPWPADPNAPVPGTTTGTTNFGGQTPPAPAPRPSNTVRNNGPRRSLATDMNTGINQSEAANVTQAAPTPDATSWWAPHLYKYFIGYEGAVAGGPLLAQNTVAFGYWMGPRWGLELYLGFTRTTGNYTESTSTVTDAVANSQSITTTFAGDQSVPQLTIGLAPKYRFYQNDWFQIAFGMVAAVTPPMSATYGSGARTVNTNNLDTPNTQVITETGYGQKQQKQDWMLQAGPRLNAEFYLKWFPHLALGLETGILATVGGYTTTTTNSRSRTYAVINGVEQPPSSATGDVTTVAQSTPKPGARFGTFGIGGTSFGFNTLFSIRYVW